MGIGRWFTASAAAAASIDSDRLIPLLWCCCTTCCCCCARLFCFIDVSWHAATFKYGAFRLAAAARRPTRCPSSSSSSGSSTESLPKGASGCRLSLVLNPIVVIVLVGAYGKLRLGRTIITCHLACQAPSWKQQRRLIHAAARRRKLEA